jgi:carbon-monoxide dehydrogenase large subunit
MNVAATYASAAGGVVVEVDPATGAVHILDAAIVHDCGRVINPMIVDGQIQGAFAQAVGTVFLEELVYSPEGQPLATTLLDYVIPAFGSVPRVRIKHRETPSELAGGFRGAGEAAIIVMPAALVNAVQDALSPLGARVAQTNLRPTHVRRILREAGHRLDPTKRVRLHGFNLP